MPTSYSQQSSLGFQYLVEKNTTLDVNYHFTRGMKLARTRNVNLFPAVVLTAANAAELGVTSPTPQQIGQEIFSASRLDPSVDNVYQLENAASSNYHGLSVSLTRKLTELNFAANYTFSKTIDDASDFDEQPQNPYATFMERALCRNQQKHHFTLSALWELKLADEGWKRVFSHIELAPILTLGSGRPLDPLTGLDSNRGGAWPLATRPLGFARNSLMSPYVANLDFRINKAFPIRDHGHVSLMVDFFNMLNRRNVSALNPMFGSGAKPLAKFGLPIESQRPRENQFAVEWEF
jgi:hypothetical protein